MPNWELVRQDFSELHQNMNGERLAYLDNAATSLKPTSVIDRLVSFYQRENANVHRGTYQLSFKATAEYENARKIVQRFINAKSSREIIFTRGTTESINLIAATYGEQNIESGDEIVISLAEHHSNLIPWQQLAIRKKAVLKYINLTPTGEIDLADAKQKITAKTKIVAVAHIGNVLGNVSPIRELAEVAHQNGAIIVVDGAQAACHVPIDVQKLAADFYAFSGHKMLGPTGIGVLYGNQQLLEQMPPYQFGGEMITDVQLDNSQWDQIPYKFEAGTPNIAGAVGLATAIKYLEQVGMTQIKIRDTELMAYLVPKLIAIPGVKVYGSQKPQQHVGVVSFNLGTLHPHDVATALDMEGVAVRAGHHCAEPLVHSLGTNATVRASLAFYNNQADCDQLINAIKETKEFFKGELR
ncbi:aminotransferase class V-fold PLP-dependent enzyme [Limosilactobacillus urinaemulieris]|uniref:aminotransferase class V-fold PLP-dependent enzyme n=1 Tax=Limosilactobacillus urinaemulieris TaxID=2742600 RepID=UPI001F5A7210|nr:SufS family cysteine desulfurase [Limosilactobacillus urinaemulieris]